jgi:PAS domain S-box-containing protein
MYSIFCYIFINILTKNSVSVGQISSDCMAVKNPRDTQPIYSFSYGLEGNDMDETEMIALMRRFERIRPRAGVDATVVDWLKHLEENFPDVRFAFVFAQSAGDDLQAFDASGQRFDWRVEDSDPSIGVLRHVLRTDQAEDMNAVTPGNGVIGRLLRFEAGTTRAVVLFPSNDEGPDRGALIAGHLKAIDIAADARQRLSLLALKLGVAIGQARDLETLALTCGELERKCSLRLSALKKTVQKLENEIRERKKAEAALLAKEEQFKAIADYTYDWESWFGEDGRLLWVNPTVERLTGHSPQACFGMDDYPLEMVLEKDRPHIKRLLAQALAERTTGNDVEFRIQPGNGQWRWMAISWQPIYNDFKTFMGVRTSIRDISQRKQAEEKLKRSHDMLEEEVARRTVKVRSLQKRLQAENLFLKKELADSAAYGEIIGESPSIKTIISQIELVAPTQANVLILGESGTGKELVAREIHRHSHLKDHPFVRVNCATIPKDLYESEFFGHVKGAFTSAVRDRIGRFEAADGGTLFLDEVGEIPLPLQGKLLRVLQEGEFERVGEGRTRKVTVRIIAATNTQLQEEVRNKRFREDLYYRLNVFPIEITPLRSRKDDLPLLAGHFIDRYAKRLSRPTPKLTKANLIDLQAYDWPGNVRELQNIIERALILSPGGRLHFELPARALNAAVDPGQRTRQTTADILSPIMREDDIKAFQKRNIMVALTQARGKIYGEKGAAKLLGLKPTTLTERMKAMAIPKPGYAGTDKMPAPNGH